MRLFLGTQNYLMGLAIVVRTKGQHVVLRLKTHRYILHGYFNKWGLRLNVGKSASVPEESLKWRILIQFHPLYNTVGKDIKFTDKTGILESYSANA